MMANRCSRSFRITFGLHLKRKGYVILNDVDNSRSANLSACHPGFQVRDAYFAYSPNEMLGDDSHWWDADNHDSQ
jgi:hypothetical protein